MEVLEVPAAANKVNREFQCNFCPVSFSTLEAKYEHVYNHFENLKMKNFEICQNCDQRLLRIAGELYILHGTVTCVQRTVKTEAVCQEKHDAHEREQKNPQFITDSINQISSIEVDPIEILDFNQTFDQVDSLELKQELDLDYEYATSDPTDALMEIVYEPFIKTEEIVESQAEREEGSDSSEHEEYPEGVRTPVNDDGSKVFHCEYCPKRFNSKWNRYIHTVRFHKPNLKKYKCDKCKLGFVTRAEMARHNKIQPKICIECNELFCSKCLLQFHRQKQCSISKENRMEEDVSVKPDVQTVIQNTTIGTDDRQHIETIDIEAHNSKFQCPVCMKMFKAKYNVEVHFIGVHAPSTKQHKCSVCGMLFLTKHHLGRHNKIVPKICGSCNERFCSNAALRLHYIQENLTSNQLHTSDSIGAEQKIITKPAGVKKVHQCTECSEIFRRRLKLTEHLLLTHRSSQIKHKCDKCLKPFVHKRQLENHNQSKFICNRCGESFCVSSLYQIHIADQCKSKDQCKCKHEGCNEMVGPNEWVRHFTKRHNDIYKRFVCDICKKTYNKKDHIRAHILNCHSKSSEIQNRKRSHSKQHNFVCPECGKTFMQKNQLKVHSNTHSGAKPFECHHEGCSKRFGNSTQRIEHMRMHTGEKPYVCPVEGCDRRFAYSVGLRRHKFSGHGIYTKKHPCHICSEVFSEGVLLNRHMRKHENQI